MRKSLLLITSLLSFFAGKAQTVWSTDVAAILFDNCASCHRPTGIGPFSLLNFGDAQAYSGAIKSAVQNKRMPPWPPDATYSRFAHERMLSQQDIDKIVDWVNDGAQQGDPNLAPPTPVFNPNGDLPGTPDLVTKIPTYTSTASTGDVYQCFVIPSGINVDKFISAFEAIPGNRPMVHHVLVYADTTGTCAQLDAQSPGPGYVSFGGPGTNDAILLGGWVPGTSPMKYPDGFGVRLPANTDIVIQVHYPAGTAGQQDSTEIHFFFTPTTSVRDVYIVPVLNHVTNINPPLFIPANQVRTFTEQYAVPAFINFTLLGVAPHMHLIGRNISVFGVTSSLDTQKYINIPDWNFHWQGFYMFPRLKKIAGGTTVYSKAFYDNTSNNPFNPSNPPQDVHAGEATTDEMMLTYFIFTNYQNGDEDIVIDSTLVNSVSHTNYYHGKELLQLFPNPASSSFVLKCFLEQADRVQAELLNIEGKLVATLLNNQQLSKGYHAINIKLPDVAAGNYIVRFRSSQRTSTEKLVITK